ncbi:MAG: SCO family protein [Acidobacteriota bacterium]
MSNRRKVIAAGAVAIPDLALAASGWTFPEAAQDPACERPARGPKASYFPNAVVTTHEGERALFYDDLLAEKTVLINCMSVRGDEVYPVTENLSKVQPFFGDRLGRDVFMYSLSVDPEHDTPEVLREFAQRYGAQPGWSFLTGTPEDMEALRSKLFSHNPGLHHGGAKMRDCSVGLARYGNEAIGLWGSVPCKADPEWIARRLSWVVPRDRQANTFKRRGPSPLPEALQKGVSS